MGCTAAPSQAQSGILILAAAESLARLASTSFAVHWRHAQGVRKVKNMSDVKQVLERNITAVNSRDIDGYLGNQCPDVQFVLPGGITLEGREQVKEYTQAIWAAFPDGALAFGEQICTEEGVATEVVFTGTQTGPMPTPGGLLPPTGKRVTLRSVSMLRIKDGMVASERVYLDQLEMLTQLGFQVVPPDARDQGACPIA